MLDLGPIVTPLPWVELQMMHFTWPTIPPWSPRSTYAQVCANTHASWHLHKTWFARGLFWIETKINVLPRMLKWIDVYHLLNTTLLGCNQFRRFPSNQPLCHVGMWGERGHPASHIHTRATPKFPATEPTKNTSPTYSPRIHGWDLCWLELLVAMLCPSSNHSSSSSQHKF